MTRYQLPESNPTTPLLLVLAVWLVSAGPAAAADFSLELDAQPLQVALIGGLSPPGSQESRTFADTASGLRARLDIYFLHLEFDFQHFYDQALDWIHAGVGYQTTFPAKESEWWGSSEFVLRAQAGMLVLGGTPETGTDYQTLTGVRAGATLGWAVAFTTWLSLEINMDLGFVYMISDGSFGYTLGVFTTLGLRV